MQKILIPERVPTTRSENPKEKYFENKMTHISQK